MVRKLDLSDFRARRLVLDPEDFALGDDEPDPPPTDLVTEGAWNGIMTLPGDVAIRTTSYQGTRITLLHELWSGWVRETPHSGIVSESMMDAADDFQAALFNLLHGFYKQAIAALRNALETVTLACACEISDDSETWATWQRGEEIRFKLTCDRLQSLPNFRTIEDKARRATGTAIYAGDDGSGRNAWARNLYQRLSRFSHARGNSTNAQLWESNGPIYSAEGMRIAYHTYLESYSLLLLVAKMAMAQLKMPAEARVIYKLESLKQYLPPPIQTLCTFHCSELFPKEFRRAKGPLKPSSS